MEPHNQLEYREKLIRSLLHLQNPETIRLLAEHAVNRHYQPGEQFFGIGELHKVVGFLLEGIAQCEYFDEGNSRHVMGFYNSWGYPLVTPSTTHKTTCRGIATTELQALEIPVEIIAGLLESDIELLWAYNQLMNWAIVVYSEFTMMLRMPAANRYAWMRKNLDGVDEHASAVDIASFLGISTATLSRLRKQYALEPLPRVTGTMCEIGGGRDMNYLKASAQKGFHQFGLSGAVEDLAEQA